MSHFFFRMHHHFPDLAACYSSARIDQLCLGPPGAEEGGECDPSDRWSGLDEFGSCLSSLTRYNRYAHCAVRSMIEGF